MVTYKFYKAQVTGAGYMPQGECKGTLTLDEHRNPSWTDLAPDFQELCVPWFGSTVRMGIVDTPEPLVPYSEEALEHLSKHQLPSQGFVMVKIQAAASTPRPYGYQPPFIPRKK
jgi:hypothetical protein